MTGDLASATDSRPIGQVLRNHRLNGNLTQTDLARSMGFAAATISLVERGEQAPSQQYLERFTKALTLPGRTIAELWQLYRAEPELGSDGSARHRPNRMDCPYRGLFSFREEDAFLFHGREKFVKRLRSKITQSALVGIVGASGSGKSSVVFAGLVPTLREQDKWLVVAFRPGADPYEALAAAITEVMEPRSSVADSARHTAGLASTMRAGGISLVVEQVSRRLNRPVLLFADQFEELFTHCQDSAAMLSFLGSLADLAGRHPGATTPVKFLLTLRGDFYGRVVGHRAFSDALQDQVVHLPPMNRAELRRAIAEPARAKHLRLEDGLVDRILDDVGNEPGNLPLLEFALTLLWEHQEAGVLTHTAYEKIGEVAGAVASQAEDAYSSFAPEQQNTARQLLTQLVRVARPGEEENDARRRTPMAEIAGLARVDRVLAALADARLIVTDADELGNQTVEVAHEAVIRSWGRLRAWLDEDRQFLFWQQRMRRWYQEWQANPDDEAAILRGRILAEAETWVAARGTVMIAADLLNFIAHSADVRAAAGDQRAVERIDVLLAARSPELPAIMNSFAGHEAAVHARVRELLGRLADTEEQRSWRLRLVLAAADPAQAADLVERLDVPEPDEVVVAREILRTHKQQLLNALWRSAGSLGSADGQEAFRAAVLLADYDPGNERWAELAAPLATELVSQDQLFLGTWLAALRPVVGSILDPLVDLVADGATRDTVREAAVSVLHEIAPNRSDILARVACDGPPQTYHSTLTAFASAIRDPQNQLAGLATLQSIAHARSESELTETGRVVQGRRRAMAMCTLLRVGSQDGILQLLEADPDPELATQFAHRAKPHGLSADLVARLVDHSPTADARYAALMALGSYEPADFRNSAEFERAHSMVIELHSGDDDAGIHSACEWVDRRWGGRLRDTRLRAPYDPTGTRRWFTATIADTHLTFCVLQPGRFHMGSPDSEAERSDYESPRQVTEITRPFALCSRQVTRGEFEMFMDVTGTIGLPNIDEWSPLKTEPVVAPTWYESVNFCEWLSAEAQIDGAGFRLPQEAEWEYACRAHTVTAYSFGSDRSLLNEYAWTASNSGLKTHEAGILRPNPAGLFNIHGQCWEWCQDWYGPYSHEPVTDPSGPAEGERKVLRGGCWNLGDRYARSACRNAHIPPNRNYYITFRLAISVAGEHLAWSG